MLRINLGHISYISSENGLHATISSMDAYGVNGPSPGRLHSLLCSQHFPARLSQQWSVQSTAFLSPHRRRLYTARQAISSGVQEWMKWEKEAGGSPDLFSSFTCVCLSLWSLDWTNGMDKIGSERGWLGHSAWNIFEKGKTELQLNTMELNYFEWIDGNLDDM
jgi:hypothetical protein